MRNACRTKSVTHDAPPAATHDAPAVTTAEVRRMIALNRRPTEAIGRAMQFLYGHEGKRIDDRLIRKLNEAHPGYNYRLERGRDLRLVWGPAWHYTPACADPAGDPGDPVDAGSRTLAAVAKGAKVDMAEITRLNNFMWEVKHNTDVEKMCDDETLCDEMAAAYTAFLQARDRLRAMLDTRCNTIKYRAAQAFGIHIRALEDYQEQQGRYGCRS